jgi:endoglucanase
MSTSCRNQFSWWPPLAVSLALLLGGVTGALGGSHDSGRGDERDGRDGRHERDHDRGPRVKVLQTRGTKWVEPNGKPIILKGTNIGNWLLQEMWMMGQSGVPDQCTLEDTLTGRFGAAEKERLMRVFRDNWITERDWNIIASFDFNVVRLPFLYSLLEDDANPFTLRADAWQYLDHAIAQAEARGMYVILDLHGAAGSQGWEHHSGCAGRNWFWDGGNGHPASYYQDRTLWLWQQIAARYRGRRSIAAYGLLNEPWGTDPDTLAEFITRLYGAIREVDRDHIIVLPGHSSGIDAYGDPAERGMKNVAFEMHFYPGLFGWGQIGYTVHRDWLLCGSTGTTGVCEWRDRLRAVDTPFLVGEMQPWVGQGDSGGEIARASYDRYASFGWATTAWSYKVVSGRGGQGNGTWGMVTNASTQETLVRANTWDCNDWDSTFANACAEHNTSVRVGGDGSPRTMYLVVKSGACCGGTLDVVYDEISFKDDVTGAEMVVNGGFGSGAGWTEWNIAGTQTFDFNYTANTPSGGAGGGYRVTGPDFNNGGIYQAITLQSGRTYTLSGVFKDVGSAPFSAWAEIYLVADEPVPGVDITGSALPNLDFATAPLSEIEALFQLFGTLEYDVHLDLLHWMTTDERVTIFRDIPAPPKDLTVVDNGSSASLSWKAKRKHKLSGYRLYRGRALGNYSLLAELDARTRSYTDNTIIDGLTYHYVVSAFDSEDESFFSNVATLEGDPLAIPGQIEAEFFGDAFGVQFENTSDTGGGLNIAFLDAGDWFEYTVDVQASGTYVIEYRVASAVGSDGFELTFDGLPVDAQTIPNTTGWQTWTTIASGPVSLAAGRHTMRFNVVQGSWNMNWIRFTAN